MNDSDRPPAARFERVAVVYNSDYDTVELGEDDAEPPSPPSQEADAAVADTAHAVHAHLSRAGFDPILITLDTSLSDLLPMLREARVEAVFNLVESLGSDPAREPEVPAMLESGGIPYTGNSPDTLYVSHAKDLVRRLLSAHHIPIPRGAAIRWGRHSTDVELLDLDDLAFPMFVKPARTDASIGIDQGSIVHTRQELIRRLDWLAATLPGPYLVEEYLPGRELNVAIFPNPFNGFIAVTEIDFSPFPDGHAPIVTYDCKWRPATPEFAAFSAPARGRLPDSLLREATRVARAAFLAVGGTSYGRVDVRLDAEGRPRVIDVNPNPDIHPDAGLAIAAGSVDLTYQSLVTQVMTGASSKARDVPAPHTSRRPRAVSFAAAPY